MFCFFFSSFRFSINFAQSDENFIEYHFKYILENNTVIDNFKDHGEWFKGTHTVINKDHPLVKTNDRQPREGSNGDELVFHLMFNINENGVRVYNALSDGYEIIREYNRFNIQLSKIKKILLWGDVEEILEFTLYK